MKMTPFKRYLWETLHLYFSANWAGDSFLKTQRLRDNLLTDRNNGNVTYEEYKALYPLVNHLIDEMRNTLKSAGVL